MLCEEIMITTKARSALSLPHNTKQAALAVIQGRLTNIVQIVR
jgi:hypothetical protein